MNDSIDVTYERHITEMTESSLPSPEPDFLSNEKASPLEEEKKASSKTKVIGGLASLAVLVGVAGVGAYAYNLLNSSGDYPYAHMSDGAIFYAQTNLDPDAEQKLAINSLVKKFPELSEDDAKKLESENINASILEDTFSLEDGEEKIDFSWVGSRMAIAVYPDGADEDTEPEYAVLIEAKDPTKVTDEILENLAESATSIPAPDVGFDEYGEMQVDETQPEEMSAVLYDEKWVGVTEASSASEIFESESILGEHDGFMDVFGDADGSVLGAWFDGSAAYEEWKNEFADGDEGIDVTVEGSASVSLEVREDGLDLVARTQGLLINGDSLGPNGDEGAATELLEESSYEDAGFSLAIAGLGDAVADAIEQSGETIPEDISTDEIRDGLGDLLAFSLAGDSLDTLRLNLVLKGVDEAVINELLEEENVTLEELELQASSQLGKSADATLEDGTLTFKVGDSPEGGQEFDEGDITGRVGLDPLARLIYGFFGDPSEAPKDLGVIDFWSSIDDNGDGEGRVSWTTPR